MPRPESTALIDALYDQAIEETLHADGPIDDRARRLSAFARSLGSGEPQQPRPVSEPASGVASTAIRASGMSRADLDRIALVPAPRPRPTTDPLLDLDAGDESDPERGPRRRRPTYQA